MKKSTYYTVMSFMVDELNLSGVKKDIYAIVYGFSQAEDQSFTGSISYLCEWTRTSKQTVITALKELVADGLLEKEEVVENGVKHCKYRALMSEGGSQIFRPGSQNFGLGVVKNLDRGGQIFRLGGSQIFRPNNNNINIIEYIIDNNIPPISPIGDLMGGCPSYETLSETKPITISEILSEPLSEQNSLSSDTKKGKRKRNGNKDKFIAMARERIQDEISLSLIGDMISYRETVKHPFTDSTFNLFMKTLFKLSENPEVQRWLLEYAVERGWRTVYMPSGYTESKILKEIKGGMKSRRNTQTKYEADEDWE